MQLDNQWHRRSGRRNIEAELFYREMMAGGSVRLRAPTARLRVTPVEDMQSETAIGQAQISGRQVLVDPSGASIGRAAELDDTVLATLARHAGNWVVRGDALGGASFVAQAWQSGETLPVPRTIEFDARDAAALVVGGGRRVYLQARPTAAKAADKLAWVHVPSVEEFLRLPVAQRASQRNDWLRFIQRASLTHPVNRTSLTADQLSALASPVLRLLLAENAAVTLPVQTKTRDGADRGGVVNGVTLPILRYPIVEPQAYLRVISDVEGKMESINAWDVGAGISLGPIQINVQREALFRFMWDVWREDQPLFSRSLGNDWQMREVGGHPELRVHAAGREVWLRATTNAEQQRCFGYFQSGDPALAGVRDIDAAHRRRLAANFAKLVAWPHVQELLEDACAGWLQPGLAQIHAAGIPVLDPDRPDRDLFVLKSLLLSTYVRFSGCLGSLIDALRPWPTVREKLGHWQDALSAAQGACNARGTPEQRARNAELATRLDHQVRDAQAVFRTLEGTLDSRRVGSQTAAAAEHSSVLTTHCGFGEATAFKTLAQVRESVRGLALEEWNRWHTPEGLPQRENDIARFGDLVRYQLSAIAAMAPDALAAIQAATSSPIAYAPVPAAGATDVQIQTWATGVAQQLLASAAGVASTQRLVAHVARAIARARDAHLNGGKFSAWSAVWVTSCVRGAAIQLGIEAMSAGRHVGANMLLLPTTRHSEYTLEAHRRRVAVRPTDGTWQAFPPADREPNVGDIIVQDRDAQAPAVPLTYSQIDVLSAGRALHGDIVVERRLDHVVTIGGNLGGSCRKRRYPTRNDRIVVERHQLYGQEDDSGLLAARTGTTTAPLHVRSTMRILAVLSPVESCATLLGQPYSGGILT